MKRSTCVYLIKEGSWLMLLRNKKQNDINEGKWIGVGGKNEHQETFETCAVREVAEETGCTVHKLEFMGIVDFRYSSMEPEQIAVYTCHSFSGMPGECREGTLAWIPEQDILNLSLWEGDRVFLTRILQGQGIPFAITLEYDAEGNLTNVTEGELKRYE